MTDRDDDDGGPASASVQHRVWKISGDDEAGRAGHERVV